MSDSFGDVVGEYTTLRTGAGAYGDSHRALSVVGDQAVEFLDGQLSQDIAALSVGDVGRSLLLEPRGKLTAVLWVLRRQNGATLVVDEPALDSTVEQLRRFLFRVDAEVAVVDAPVVAIIGPNAAAALQDPPALGKWTVGPPLVASAPLGGLSRFFVIGDPPDGVRHVGRLAYDAVRIEAGEPVVGIDVDDSTIPQEAGLVSDTVSFTKGCYLGQELVARIDSRGRVNRHLRGVVIESNVLPPLSAEVVAGDQVVGVITSVAESLTVMAPIALGLIRREVTPGDAVVVRWEGGSTPARVEALPLDDFTSG